MELKTKYNVGDISYGVRGYMNYTIEKIIIAGIYNYDKDFSSPRDNEPLSYIDGNGSVWSSNYLFKTELEALNHVKKGLNERLDSNNKDLLVLVERLKDVNDRIIQQS